MPAKTVKNVEPDTGGKKEVFIPRGQANEDPNFFVSVNGKNYLLPRGKKSLVPREVYFEIQRALVAEERMNARRDELLESNK